VALYRHLQEFEGVIASVGADPQRRPHCFLLVRAMLSDHAQGLSKVQATLNAVKVRALLHVLYSVSQLN
jgi:hypothetical protein